MTTVQLTDAQLAQFTACGLIVVDGEQWEYQDERNKWHKGANVAPELWRKLTDPCPTCDGRGTVPSAKGWHPPARRPCLNPDCADGCQVVTFVAACPRCQNDPPCEHKLESGSHGWGCTKCGLSGVGPLLWHRDGTKCENREVALGRFVLTMKPLDGGRFEIATQEVK